MLAWRLEEAQLELSADLDGEVTADVVETARELGLGVEPEGVAELL